MDKSTIVFANISFANIISSLLSIEKLIVGAAYLMGISFGIKALFSLKKLAEAKSQMADHGSIKEPLIYLLVAAMFLYFPTGFAVLMQTTFGYTNVLTYVPVTSGSSSLQSLFGDNSAFGYTLSVLIQVVGAIAFVRGWVLIARSAAQGQPPGGTGTGLVHVFGGILAMNIVGTLQIVNNTIFGV